MSMLSSGAMTDTEVQSNHEQDHEHDVDHDLVSNSGAGGTQSRSGAKRGPATNTTTKSPPTKDRDKSILVADDTKALVVGAARTTGRSHDAVVKIAMTYYAAKKGWEPKLNDEAWVAAQLRDL